MFDKVIVTPTETRHVPYEKTVTIKRAPTDESIRLWDEMKDKAYKSILGTLVVSDNSLNLSAIAYRDMLSLEFKVAYKVVLNGRDIAGVISVKSWDEPERMELLGRIHAEVAKELALELTNLIANSHEIKWSVK